MATPTSLQGILRREPQPVFEAAVPQDEGPRVLGLKHRLLVYMWKRACEARENKPNSIRSFHYHFDQYKGLCMWKMQIINNSTLLVKFGGGFVVPERCVFLKAVVLFAPRS